MYDVVVVGGSIAGCTAAMLYGRAGLRVALVERSRSIDAYKAMCGHFVLGGAQATLQRLGVWDAMVAEGAAVARPSVWVGSGWVPAHDDVPAAISLRRAVLDPLLRRTAAATPGVDLLLGHEAIGVLEDARTVVGLRARTAERAEVELPARLVVAADGHRSPVAALAGVTTKTAPNERFLYWAYYRGVRHRAPGDAHVWLVDPDAAASVPTDAGLTLLGAFPVRSRLDEFAGDRHAALEAFFADLPDGPDLSGAERASKVVGTSEHTFARRDPVPRPGLALVGDAATASDPVPAVGCGWAFRTAESLADETAAALVSGDRRALRVALRRYRRRHRIVERYDALARSDARAQPPNPVQRALRTAALRDDDIRRRLGLFAMRAAPVSTLLNPVVVARALAISRQRHEPPQLAGVAVAADLVDEPDADLGTCEAGAAEGVGQPIA